MRVCANCFSDKDLADFIVGTDAPPGCDYCQQADAPTAQIEELGAYVLECLQQFYGYAADQLPYESREGGYLGPHWDTWDLLYDIVGTELPRDRGQLSQDLANYVGDEVWCDYDWLRLDLDDALRLSWDRFCELVKHKYRFFFRDVDQVDEHDPDTLDATEMLTTLGRIVAEMKLIDSIDPGQIVYRARPDDGEGPYLSAAQLGPPPPENARQANRMNPPGIPMFYGAFDSHVAIAEVGGKPVFRGEFELLQSAQILDLENLPDIPGIFANPPRNERLSLIFLHKFQQAITKPVPRDDRIHIDYIPSQVVTEYFRTNLIADQKIQGIRFPSSLVEGGSNLVLFVSRDEVADNADKGVLLKLTSAKYLPAHPLVMLWLVTIRTMKKMAQIITSLVSR